MSPDQTAEPVLDEGLAAFIEGPVSTLAASRDEQLTPSLAHTLGCAVSTDRRTVRLLVAASQAPDLLADLRRGAPIAVVFTLPSSHRAMQLKAPHAEVLPAGPADQILRVRYAERFAAELVLVGHPPDLAQAYLSCDPSDLVVLSFTPHAAYSQTPGPGAGESLRALA